MNKTFTYRELKDLAKEIIQNAPTKTLCFYGGMGAGKTTLIKAIVAELGAIGDTSSPSFGIVNEYQDKTNKTIAYHFDFYRLEDEMEALDIGVEDYFYAGKWVFIEWPEKISSFLPDNRTNIKLEVVSDKERKINIL
ncbi:tRNA (adenosine(37)-N6)-threonylcarbamoyltransferase complex ATPase subunit type 1 TsaE [Cellulophaga sp. F20128]|uniref:tRNA (adenosine(37)-N6)-threonylcarbamoyltransferase complex ATPase subunit type 1 TsaE n=1 Tax=Cellulophaga sp. F20128 TaxID=2926413 RepID=UPI001FF5BE8B|nr:tRNA (adenosine(37)-N6)-threonylcarbamoyltransferase complex ATPase subunit type 1 TsaE [Cellulophaga sp. F20128]MCK0157861.1 tRNA (adenosine(37)-N6)-threonylcarbamoyltransferase complex ATPase subunit type 1 TsaE [Cellulophaga sp. F20128]